MLSTAEIKLFILKFICIWYTYNRKSICKCVSKNILVFCVEQKQITISWKKKESEAAESYKCMLCGFNSLDFRAILNLASNSDSSRVFWGYCRENFRINEVKGILVLWEKKVLKCTKFLVIKNIVCAVILCEFMKLYNLVHAIVTNFFFKICVYLFIFLIIKRSDKWKEGIME